MATDYWPQEEGCVLEGAVVANCYASAAITLNSPVYISATTAGTIVVTSTAAVGDARGLALRAAGAAGDMIPVAFEGIVKVTAQSTVAIGNALAGKTAGGGVVQYLDTDCEYWNGGTAYVLGMALQAAGTTGDEILMLLGY